MIFFSWCSYVLDACFITFWKKSQPDNQLRMAFSFKRIECCLLHQFSSSASLFVSNFVVVQLLSHVCKTPGFPVLNYLLEFAQTHVHYREGNGTPLQYSCLENPMDRGAWWAAVHGVTKSWTRLSDFTLTFHFHALEKEMATHSSVLAWRIPGTVEPGGLPSMGSHRVRHDWSDLAAAACPLSQWCHPAISSSVIPFSCLQSFPASGSFPMSWLFTSVGQSIGALASTSVLPINIQGWFPLRLTGLISLLSKGLSRVFPSSTGK